MFVYIFDDIRLLNSFKWLDIVSSFTVHLF